MSRKSPEPPDHAPALDDDLAGGLRADLWVDHCLPHWTTPERSEARYVVTSAGLQLRIAADQVDWRPEGARLRVSNIQAGVFSGETDSCAVPTTIGWMG